MTNWNVTGLPSSQQTENISSSQNINVEEQKQTSRNWPWESIGPSDEKTPPFKLNGAPTLPEPTTLPKSHPETQGKQIIVTNPPLGTLSKEEQQKLSFNNTVDTEVNSFAEKNNLSDAQKAQLKFAYYHPEIATEEQKTQIALLQANVKTNLEKQNLTLPDKTDFSVVDQPIINDFDRVFEAFVAAKYPDKATRLKTVHYHPSWGTDAEKKLVSDLDNAALAQVKKQHSLDKLPPNFPKADAEYFDAVLTKAYQGSVLDEFQTMKASGNLTSAELEVVQNLLKGGTNIPAGIDTQKINSAVETIKNGALSQTRGLCSLPETWVAPAGIVAMVGQPTVSQNSLQVVKDMQRIATNYANKLPDGPAKMVFQDFLKAIGEALTKLQQLIYEMETIDAMRTKEFQNAQKDLMDTQRTVYKKKMDEQAAKQKEMEEKQAKNDKVQKIMKPLGYVALAISVVVTVASFGTLGPLAIALSLAMISSSISASAGGTDFMAKGFNLISRSGIGKVLGQALMAMGVPKNIAESTANTIAVAAVIAVTVFACSRGGGAAGAGMGLMVSAQLVGTSNAAYSIAKDAGINDKDAAFGAMIATVCFTIVACIAGGALMAKSAGKTVENLTRQVENSKNVATALHATAKAQYAAGETAKAAATYVKYMGERVTYLTLQFSLMIASSKAIQNPKLLGNIIQNALGIATSGVQIDKSVRQMEIYDIQGEVARMRADLEAFKEIIKKYIDDLREMIQELSKMMENFTSALAMVGQTQSHTYDTYRKAIQSLPS